MAKKSEDVIVKVTPVSINKNFIQPVSITEDFVTFPCFKYVKVERVVVTGKNKEDIKKDVDRYPIILAWDGKKITWAVSQRGQDIVIKKQAHIIDRHIDDNPSLPSEKFVAKLMDPILGKKMMDKFKPQDFFKEIYNYFERYFYLEKPYLHTMMALFVANIWVFDAHDSTPYLFVRSPIPGCGKTNLGTSIANMCNGLMIVSPNAVHIFRLSHGAKTTLVFDEIKRLTSAKQKQTQDDKDVLSLINTGFQKYGSKTPRAAKVTIGGVETYRIDLFDGYTPKVLITTDGVLPPDTYSRCIDLRMQVAPKDTKYDELWTEKERLERLEKIREMGLLFRFKYGREILAISNNPNWRRELDTPKLFSGIKNRDLEIFRPLITLTLKYMPKWKDGVNTYIRKYIDMKKDFEPTLAHNLLWTLRCIYNDVLDSSFDQIEDEDCGTISIEEDELYGATLRVPPKYIADRMNQMGSVYLGKNPASAVGKKLNELGFLSGDKKERNRRGRIRVIKIKQLEDMCERYLGTGLSDDVVSLTQAERVGLICELLHKAEDGLTPNELLAETDSRMTEDQMNATVNHLRDRGRVVQRGKVLELLN